MKNKLLLLLLISSFGFAQTNPTAFNKLKITGNEKDNTATRVIVQDSITKELKWVLKSSIKSPIAKSTVSGTVKTTTDVADPFVYNTIETDAKLLLKEDKTNKQNSLTADGTNTKYPTVTAVNTGLANKQNIITNPITGLGTINTIPIFTAANTLGNSILSTGTNLITANVGATKKILFGRNGTYTTVPAISMNETLSDALMAGFFADDLNFYINSPNRIILRAGGNALNTNFVIGTNSSVGLGYGDYNANPISTANSLAVKGNLLIGKNSDNGKPLQVVGSAEVGSLTISTTPTTSTGTPDIITRNPTTGAVESVPYSTFLTASNNMLLTGNQTATGRKSFNSDNTTAGGINVINNKSTASTFGDNYGIYVDNRQQYGVYASSKYSSLGAIYGHTENTAPALLLTSSGAALGNMLTAGGTTIDANGKLKTNSTPTATTDVTNKNYVDSKTPYNNLDKTANYTVVMTDFIGSNELIISVNASAGNVTITLPAFATLRGSKVTVKKMDSSANSVNITGAGGVNIDGASNLEISGQYGKATIVANSYQYLIL